jgi:predicted transposase/invertase (TIGR01784 family)
VRKQQDFSLRAQYYVGCAMANQLEAGQTYNKILPVIFIGVIDFELFRTPTCLSHHLVLNKDSHEHAIKEIEFHFIELPKFKKTIEQLETETDKWIFFLDKAEDFSMVPSELKNPIAVKDALNVLDRGTWSKEDLMQYEKALDDERVAQSVLRTAQEDGRAEGKAEGRAEGRTEGRTEGRAEGEKIGMEKEKFEVAKKMISKGLSIDTICEITGLNHEEVKALVPSKFGQT